MKRLKAVLLAGLTVTMLFGCGKSGDEAVVGLSMEKIDQVQEVTPVATEETSVAEETEVVDDEVPPREGMVRSYFTNEWVDEAVNKERPLAVMYPLNKEAQPQYGLNKVAVFYEIMEEGSMSRQMGILEDWEGLGQIGNLRSIRDYFIYAALEYDPVIVHYGGPELYVKTILTRDDVDNINGVGGVMGPDYGAFYRVPEGSKSEHTAFTNGEKVAAAFEKAKFSREHRDKFDGNPHFKFTSKSNPNTLESYSSAVDATEINMAGSFPVTKSALKYDADKGVYLKTLYGNAQKDAVTGEQLSFANVVIQRTYHEVRDDNGYLAYQMHDSTKTGYFITKGKMIPVKWQKSADYSPTKYFDENGEEVVFNTGRTMIFVIQEKGGSFSTFEVNGKSYAD